MYGNRILGGAVGVLEAGWDTVNGLVRIGGNTVLQIGDILTLGLNHDASIIQQAWIEQGALAAGIERLATEPITVAGEVKDRIAQTYDQAEALRAQGKDFASSVIVGKQTAEIAAAVLGTAQATREFATLGAAGLRNFGMTDWNIGVATPNPATLYSNPIPFRLELIVANSSRVPHAGGVIRQFTQETDQVYYRVFTENAEGSFLTAVPPRNSAWAQEALALPPGNTAAYIQEVLVPAGTQLERSRALAAFGRRGGAEQFELLQKIPSPNFSPGKPLP